MFFYWPKSNHKRHVLWPPPTAQPGTTAITTFGIKRIKRCTLIYSNDVDHPSYITLMTIFWSPPLQKSRLHLWWRTFSRQQNNPDRSNLLAHHKMHCIVLMSFWTKSIANIRSVECYSGDPIAFYRWYLRILWQWSTIIIDLNYLCTKINHFCILSYVGSFRNTPWIKLAANCKKRKQIIKTLNYCNSYLNTANQWIRLNKLI
jgi:hypothetical protein